MKKPWNGTVDEQVVVNASTHAANWAYQHLVRVGGVPTDIALIAAKEAGDEFAVVLVRALVTEGARVPPAKKIKVRK